jgi:hypothetical protein
MAELDVHIGPNVDSVSVGSSLESRLRNLFAEQRRLRDQLEQTRADLDRVNRQVLQFQDEFCTDAQREEEYDRCLQKVLGFDPRIDASLLEEARAGGQSMDKLIEEMERTAGLPSSREVR